MCRKLCYHIVSGMQEEYPETSSSNYTGNRHQMNNNSSSFRSSDSCSMIYDWTQNSQQNRPYSWHPKQNWDKGKYNKNRNYSKHKQNLEFLKAEGRKKLLAEAAGILSPSSTSAESTFYQGLFIAFQPFVYV